jgi:hypothetical protein
MPKLRTLVAASLFLFSLAGIAQPQDNRTALDDYLDGARTIVVARCTGVGAMNILMRADVELEVLHVVKGGRVPKTITVDSPYGMQVAHTYLVRIAKESADKSTARVDTRDSVIPVSDHEDMNVLRSLSPRIVVLRTINLRVDRLESQIRTMNYELEALKAVRKGN